MTLVMIAALNVFVKNLEQSFKHVLLFETDKCLPQVAFLVNLALRLANCCNRMHQQVQAF